MEGCSSWFGIFPGGLFAKHSTEIKVRDGKEETTAMVRVYSRLLQNIGYFHDQYLSRTRNWILDLMVHRIRCCLALLLTVVTEAATEGFLLRLFCVRLLGDGKPELFVEVLAFI
jgi:hypothetical protein